MEKTIVVALGGNAILEKDPTYEAQKAAVEHTAKLLVRLVEKGYKVIITHGNGPQVGNLLLQQIAGDSDKTPALPLDSLGAMTQGSIGYWLSNSLAKYLHRAGIHKDVVPVVTQTVVDRNDRAFSRPTKPIGPFYTEEEVDILNLQNPMFVYREDSGRGWRRVVPSPRPVRILEIEGIKSLIDAGQIVIAAGGGGVPVVEQDDELVGVEAVIDKDFTAAKLAEQVHADEFLILTSVGNVYLGFGKPTQREITHIDANALNKLIAKKQFAEGSMLPKVTAAKEFVENVPDGKAIITYLDGLEDFIEHGAGTVITRWPESVPAK